MATKRTVKRAAPKAAASVSEETVTETMATEPASPTAAEPQDGQVSGTADTSEEPQDGLVPASIRTVPGVLRFRRAGLGFGTQPRLVRVSPEVLAALRAEPMLIVE